MIRKLLFSAYQVGMFFYEYLRGGAEFRPRMVQFGWPETPWQGKFLVIGSLQVAETMLLTKVGESVYSIGQCPQKAFFQKLSQGQGIENDFYYKFNKQSLRESEFDLWLRTREQLLKEFNPLDREFLPVVVRISRMKFIVEDGAHRLSLRSLHGISSHRVEISIWYLG